MKKFLTAIFVLGASLLWSSPAQAEFPVAAGDIAAIMYICEGAEAGETMRIGATKTGRADAQMQALHDAGTCFAPLEGQRFNSTIAQVIGFSIDWEGDEFALIEIMNGAVTAGSDYYAIVWPYQVWSKELGS